MAPRIMLALLSTSLTTHPDTVDNTDIRDPIISSDHKLISFSLITDVSETIQMLCNFNFQQMNIELMAYHLNLIDWRVFFLDCHDANDMYNKFMRCCRFLIEAFTPLVVDKKLMKLRSHVARLERVITSQPDPVSSTTYHRKLMKATKRLRILTEMSISVKDSRSLFRYANSRLTSNERPPTLESTSQSASTDEEKAELLAAHFSSLFNPVPVTPVSPISASYSPTSYSDSPIDFNEYDIYMQLLSVKPKCSHTPDVIPPIFF